jgi:uncharacterized protein YbjT (DUF2867 family)
LLPRDVLPADRRCIRRRESSAVNVLVLGADGATGKRIVKQAHAAGHVVTEFAGDLLQQKSVEAAVIGQDAVCWSAVPPAGDEPSRLCRVATTNVLWAMQRAGTPRFVCESAFGVGESRWGGPYARFLRTVYWARVVELERHEEAVRASGVAWVIVRPTILTNGPRTGKYRFGTDLRLGLFPRISRADVAHFMVRQLAEPDFVRQAVTVTGL